MSGYNVLNMGIWYEALMRWLGPATKVMAMTKSASASGAMPMASRGP